MTAGDPLTINWSPNVKDAYFGLRLGFWGTAGRITRSIFLLFAFPTALAGWLIYAFAGHRLSAAQIVAWAVLFGVAWGVLFALAFGAWFARFIVKTQRAKGDPQRIVIGHDTVERFLNDSKITYPWSAISSIEEMEPAFILFGVAGPIASIEKSGIQSAGELRAVRSFLRSKKPGKYLE